MLLQDVTTHTELPNIKKIHKLLIDNRPHKITICSPNLYPLPGADLYFSSDLYF